MISGHGNIHTAVTATKFGAFDFIEKPLSLEALLLTVQRALGELSPASAKEANGNGGRKAKTGKRSPIAARFGSAGQSIKQRTLKKSIVTSGQGLHSGMKTGLILHPLPPNSGVLFAGISGDVSVPAHLDHVGSTGYATSLRATGFAVGTVEHLLAVLHSYGITNLLVKVQGEIPILDGSALEFCNLIEEAGVQEERRGLVGDRRRRPYRIGSPGAGERSASSLRSVFSVRYVLNYPKPVGIQEYTYTYQGPGCFKEEIAPARTFGFLRDIETAATSRLGQRRQAQ